MIAGAAIAATAPATAQTTTNPPAPAIAINPAPENRPDPTETPIGTEANTLTSVLEDLPRVELPATMTFKIAAWNLKSRKPGEAAEPPKPAEAPKAAWRHTFGSERTTAEWRRHGTADFVADIIALQGIDRDIHRMFNARDYHVVASRQLLRREATPSTEGDAGGNSSASVFRPDPPLSTAVAFRRRLGVRIAGFRHFLPAATTDGHEPPAITTIRLRIYGQLLWIASLDMPTDCAAAMTSETCAPHSALLADFSEWAARLAHQTAPLLLLGSWPQPFIERLTDAGLEVRAMRQAAITCSKPPAAFVIAAPRTTPREFSKLDGEAPAKSNPCVATADLTINLR